jgi:hypothetical protein
VLFHSVYAQPLPTLSYDSGPDTPKNDSKTPPSGSPAPELATSVVPQPYRNPHAGRPSNWSLGALNKFGSLGNNVAGSQKSNGGPTNSGSAGA